MVLIPREAVCRTLVGGVLKSVGMTARLLDLSPGQPELKAQAARRELVDLGVIVVASLALEGLFHRWGGKQKLNPILQFLPQLAAYVFAEWFSRRVTNYQSLLRQSLVHSGAPANRPLPLPAMAAGARFSAPLTFRPSVVRQHAGSSVQYPAG